MKGRFTNQVAGSGRKLGFTLIELLIVVAVVAILSAIALPSYQDYVRRAKVPEATSGLSTARVAMEQWYQDHRDYAAVGSPCLNPTQWNTKNFTFDCSSGVPLSANAYQIFAIGNAGQTMAGFEYSISETNAKASLTPAWGNGATCWITKKGDTC